MVDEVKLNELLGRMVGDLGAAATVALVRLGDSLGLYKALAKGPLTPAGMAAATGIAERYAAAPVSQTVQALLEGGPTDAIDDHVGTGPVGQLTDGVDEIA